MKIQVSVITPVYNGELFIQKCIESVMVQNDVSFEHIIIDDASTDNTLEIINKYNHIKIIRNNENIGQSVSRNKGINSAKGEYICFLDSDDYLVDSKVLFNWINVSNTADMIKCGNYINGNKNSTSYIFPDEHVGEFEGIEEAPFILNSTSCWQFIYKRDFLTKNNLLFSNKLKQREDRLFFFEALLCSEGLAISNLPVISYTVRADSTMRNANVSQLEQFNVHLRTIIDLIESKNISEVCLVYTIQYYISSSLNYWNATILENRNNKIVDVHLILLTKLTSFSFFDENIYIDVIRKSTSKEEAWYAFFLLKNSLYNDFLLFLESRKISFDVVKRNFDYIKFFPQLISENIVNESFINEPSEVVEFSGYNFFFHIGLPKTGTSYLQKLLSMNRWDLLKEYNIYYPYSGIENGKGTREFRTSGHALLVNEIVSGKKSSLNKLFSEIKSVCNENTLIILSCENILSERFWNEGKIINDLIKIFPKSKFVATLRNHVDWFNSYYSEMVTSPGKRFQGGLREFVDQTYDDYLHYDYLNDYFSQLEREIELLDYSNLGNNFSNFFEKVFGIQVKFKRIHDENESNVSKSYELVNFLSKNKILKNLDVEIFKKIQTLNIFSSKSKLTHYTIDDEDYINQLFFDSNVILAKKHGITLKQSSSPNLSADSDSDHLSEVSELLKLIFSESRNSYSFSRDRKDLRDDFLILLTNIFSVRGFIKIVLYSSYRKIIKDALMIFCYAEIDVEFISERYPHLCNSKNSLLHELAKDRRLKPNKDFDPERYLQANSDVLKSGLHPIVHFYRFGIREARVF